MMAALQQAIKMRRQYTMMLNLFGIFYPDVFVWI